MWSKIKCNYFQWMHILSKAGFWTEKGKWIVGLGGRRTARKKREVEPDLLGLVPTREPKHPKSNCAAKAQTRVKQQFPQSFNT